MKFRRLLAVAAAMTVFATGCGGSSMDTAEIETLLKQAKETMAEVKSMEADMTMEMDMAMAGEVLETTTVAHILTRQDPMKMKMEMSMQMDDGTAMEEMLMYAVEEDGKLKTYMYSADMWYAETLELGELNQYNAEENMDLYLDNIMDFKADGEETINGTKTTKIAGVIKGDAMEEALDASGMASSAESMGITEEMMREMYGELKDLPISLWIDAEGYVLKYEMDMTEMMQKIMDASMKAIGMAEEDIAVKIDKTAITMVCGAFDAVEDFEIPADALGAYALTAE